MDEGVLSKKVKVLFVIPNFWMGGAERVLSVLLEHLDRNKIQPFCIVYDLRRTYKVPEDVKMHCLNLPGTDSKFKKIVYTLKRIIKIKRIIKKEEPDIVFSFLHKVNLLTIFTMLLAYILKNKGKTKLFISERTTISVHLKKCKRGYREITKFLIKHFYPMADKVIANSLGIKEDLIMNFNFSEGKIDVIYNPVDIAEIDKLSQEEVVEHPWFQEDIPVIINVGSLNIPKAQSYLLKAFKLVRDKVRSRLVILGEGEKEYELKQLAEDLRITDDVAFLGFQGNPFKFVRKSSVFVLSSIYEGFPNVLIEAMACGVPVVSTRCPSGPAEIITDSVNGFLVPVKDEVKLAEAILQIITNPDMAASMAYEAKISVAKFDVKTAIKEYEKLLISCV